MPNPRKIFTLVVIAVTLAVQAPALVTSRMSTVLVTRGAVTHAAKVEKNTSHQAPSIYVGGELAVMPIGTAPGTVQYAGGGALIQGSGAAIESILNGIAGTFALDAARQANIAVTQGEHPAVAISIPVLPVAAAGDVHYSLQVGFGSSTLAAAAIGQPDLPQGEQHVPFERVLPGVKVSKVLRTQVFQNTLTFNLLC